MRKRCKRVLSEVKNLRPHDETSFLSFPDLRPFQGVFLPISKKCCLLTAQLHDPPVMAFSILVTSLTWAPLFCLLPFNNPGLLPLFQ